MTSRLFITGNGTGVGKTLVSAIVVSSLEADYWKPVQAGDLDASDSHTLKHLLPPSTVIHPEAYRLSQPMSPHAAAERDGVQIELDKIVLPETKNSLVIEGAGGVYVPLNANDTMLDLIMHLGTPVILVSHQYLGSINHTLLTWEALASRGIPIAGIIFNGERNKDSEQIILAKTKLPCLLHIEWEGEITSDTVRQYATKLDKRFL